MWPMIFAFALILAIQYFVPFIVYSVTTLTAGLKPQLNQSPFLFILGIAISKIGVTAAFVLLYYVALPCFQTHWLLYGILWWAMLVANEIGTAVGPKGTIKESVAGSISHTIAVPLSILVVTWLVK